MDVASLGIGLTPHGHLFLTHDADAPRLDERLHDRLRRAFERGPGHVLLLLGADEVGTVLPPVHSYWREFGARYVTALCTQQASPIAAPASDELDRIARAAPPMMGAEYLSAAVLEALWREIDAAFGMELSESKCSVQDFLRRRNPAWNLVGSSALQPCREPQGLGRSVRLSRDLHDAVIGAYQSAAFAAWGSITRV